MLRALHVAGVRYVLIGELAEVLHGSPLLPVTATVTILARAGQGDRISTAVTIARGRVPTLRRTLEPATSPPVVDDAA